MCTSVSLYHRHRFPAEIISHCVWLYFRFPLSFRDVEEMLAMRGVSLSYETVREWCLKFGQTYANDLRRKSPVPEQERQTGCKEVLSKTIKEIAVCTACACYRQAEELWCGEGRSAAKCEASREEISEQ